MTETTSPSPDGAPASTSTEHAGAPGGTSLWTRLADGVAVLVLVAVGPWLTRHDGGWGLQVFLPAATLVLAAVPLAVIEIRRMPRPVVALTGMWALGLLVGVAFAVHRADAVRPLIEYTFAPVVFLAAVRIWRRRWGPAVFVGVALLTFLLYQQEAWLVWLGLGPDAVWRPLSWRNPAAALMGMYAAWLLGAALGTRRVLRWALAAVAGTGLAGAFLTGSRAGLAAAVGGAIVALLVGIRTARRRGDRWVGLAGTVALAVAVAALMTAGLLALADSSSATGEDVPTPLAAREQSATGNAMARLAGWEAALGMWQDRPLTGTGTGSYRAMAPEHTPPDIGFLTSSAHNEYLEVLAENGPVAALSLLGVAAATGWLVLGRIRRPRAPAGTDDIRTAWSAGAAGAAAVFLVHIAVDFDWTYPALPALAAMALAVLVVERDPADDGTPNAGTAWVARTGVAAMTVLGLLLSAGVLAGWVERSSSTDPTVPESIPAWDAVALARASQDALDDGDVGTARAAIDRTRPWNPGTPIVVTTDLLVSRAEGRIDAAAVIAAVEEREAWMVHRAYVASQVAAEAPDAVLAMVDPLWSDLDTYQWTGLQSRLFALQAEAQAEAVTRGCASARTAVERRLADRDLGTADVDDVIAEALEAAGC